MKLPACLASLGLALLSSSCVVSCGSWGAWGADVVGSGVARTESRSVGGFERIHVNGSTDVVAEIGATPSLEVTADDNVLQYLETRVEDGTLVVELKSGSYSLRVQPVVKVVAPTLVGLEVDGSSDATISKLTGAGFAIEIDGSGNVRCSGAVDALDVDISGSGDVRARDLAAKRVTVGISGSGDVHVQALETLSVSIAGSGDVRYAGEPQVTQSIAGSGDVRRE
ncbi:MAG: DUF2807 domain-containing protein [Planctomycetes bacterium]|nr:DUF2807 domain-containing protein [Planctomycetota bacterium]